MVVAITGGTGFIGWQLVLRHLGQGDEVRVLSRRDKSDCALPGSVMFFCGGLSDSHDLTSFVDGVDVLYHCAGEVRDASLMEKVHVDGTRRLIEAASGRIGRWVQLSSVGAYGKQRRGIVTEETRLSPLGAYEITKVKSDEMVINAVQTGAFDGVVLRPSNVYGVEMRNQSLYGLIAMIHRGWFFFVGAPGATANYIHVDNVVDALILCAARPEAIGKIYNLSDSCSMEQLVTAISIALAKPQTHLRLPESPVRYLARVLGRIPRFPLTEARVDALTGRAVYSTDKIERELGYRHGVSIEAGLAGLAHSWLQRTH